MGNEIIIKGAREHNLKNITVTIPYRKFTVITGVSGAGKSSLIFDVLYKEARRRFVELFPSHFFSILNNLERPDVDLIEGLLPTIGVSARFPPLNPRVTVGTFSEIYEYLKTLFSYIGEVYCWQCGEKLTKHTLPQIQEEVLKLKGKEIVYILSPIFSEVARSLSWLQAQGFTRVAIRDKFFSFENLPQLKAEERKDVWVVVDRVRVKEGNEQRLRESLELASKIGGGVVSVRREGEPPQIFSDHYFCWQCRVKFPNFSPRLFSFNHPEGACRECQGLGEKSENTLCPSCLGTRLNQEARAVKLKGLSLPELTTLSLQNLVSFFSELSLTPQEKFFAEKLLSEILSRTRALIKLGLGYLTLARRMDTLSVGEFQRLKLAKQISGKLTGILYLFDEPTVGLHPQEIELLTQTIKSLTENGNTVVAIEHDEQLIREADKIVDLGPGPGKQGGQVLAEGSFSQLLKNTRSLTGKYLSGKLLIKTPLKRRKAGEYIEIIGANKHNLKGINIKIPVGLFTCITGVSGAGKSTLVEEVIYRALRYSLGETSVRSDGYQEVRGREKIKGVINVTQAPLTPTTLSTPVTYTKAFDYIRDFFASLPESRKRGYSPSRFSFNLKGGRCEACQGQGEVKVEIPLLGIEYQRCEICQGKRYTDEVLEITYQGKNIAEILNLSVREAEVVFRNIPKIKNILSVLREVGLDYIKLGQPASSLSGGEAQRVKIARELSRGARKKILYILDEPTRGLHFWDIAQLIQSLQRLVDKGNTLVVIEHNLEVIKAADYIIELGPGAGDEGGKIVSQGTPEEVANTRKSIIGQYLKRRLN